MEIKESLDLLKRNTVEILNESSLNDTLKKKNLKVYCGYELSGEIHIGHLVTITKLLDFQKAGITPIILLADYHTFLNKKGSWDYIKKELKTWEKGMRASGLTKAKIVSGSSFQMTKEYFTDVLTLSLETTLNRGLRSMQTVARDIDNAKISQIIYPLMQIVDIKHLDLDFIVSGLEQRKIHALGLETFSKINFKKTPVFFHTGLITSLKGPGSKMSSSIPDSMISIRDSAPEIQRKIKRAHCPEGIIEQNPVLEICKYLIFPRLEKLEIERPEKFGGSVSYKSYETLEKDFKSKKLHPADLKAATAKALEQIIAPIRKAWK